ncbi:hypothetical protein MRB53_037638 [Persea americana]|nr:hypothetical protein MRB53_037638 [Persea americana]
MSIAVASLPRNPFLHPEPYPFQPHPVEDHNRPCRNQLAFKNVNLPRLPLRPRQHELHDDLHLGLDGVLHAHLDAPRRPCRRQGT